MAVVFDVQCGACGNSISVNSLYLDATLDLCIELDVCDVCTETFDKAEQTVENLTAELKEARDQVISLERELAAALLV